jgi:hypothetical protein
MDTEVLRVTFTVVVVVTLEEEAVATVVVVVATVVASKAAMAVMEPEVEEEEEEGKVREWWVGGDKVWGERIAFSDPLCHDFEIPRRVTWLGGALPV